MPPDVGQPMVVKLERSDHLNERAWSTVASTTTVDLIIRCGNESEIRTKKFYFLASKVLRNIFNENCQFCQTTSNLIFPDFDKEAMENVLKILIYGEVVIDPKKFNILLEMREIITALDINIPISEFQKTWIKFRKQKGRLKKIEKENEFVCTVCNHSFPTNDIFQRHCIDVHSIPEVTTLQPSNLSSVEKESRGKKRSLETDRNGSVDSPEPMSDSSLNNDGTLDFKFSATSQACPFCPFITLLADELQEHVKSHKEEVTTEGESQLEPGQKSRNDYKCPKCNNFHSAYKHNVIRHMKNAHNIIGNTISIRSSNECNISNGGIKKSVVNTKIKPKCTHCGFKAHNMRYLKVHMARKHSKVVKNLQHHGGAQSLELTQNDEIHRPSAAKTTDVDQIEAEKSKVGQPLAAQGVVPSGIKIFKCHICSFLHTSEVNFQMHMKKCHRSEVVCPHCSFHAYGGSLKSHIMAKHKGVSIKQQPIRSKEFATFKAKKVKVHKGNVKQRSNKMIKLAKLETRKSSKSKIIETTENGEVCFKCPECDKKASSTWKIMAHRCQVHYKNELKQYIIGKGTCTLCNLSYTTRYMALSHLGMKHDLVNKEVRAEKDMRMMIHQCPECDLKTKTRWELLSHRCTKHYNKELSKHIKGSTCTLCKKTFSQKLKVLYHLGSEHKMLKKYAAEKSPAEMPRAEKSGTKKSRTVNPRAEKSKVPAKPPSQKPPEEMKIKPKAEGRKKIYSCPECIATRPNPFDLLAHRCTAHYKKKLLPFIVGRSQCKECGKDFGNSYKVLRHLGIVHKLLHKFSNNMDVPNPLAESHPPGPSENHPGPSEDHPGPSENHPGPSENPPGHSEDDMEIDYDGDYEDLIEDSEVEDEAKVDSESEYDAEIESESEFDQTVEIVQPSNVVLTASSGLYIERNSGPDNAGMSAHNDNDSIFEDCPIEIKMEILEEYNDVNN